MPVTTENPEDETLLNSLQTAKNGIIKYRWGGPKKNGDPLTYAKAFRESSISQLSEDEISTKNDAYVWGGCVQFMVGVIDRVINKARGLLAFNGLLLTASSLLKNSNTSPLLDFAIVLSLISSGIILSIFYIKWGDEEQYKRPEQQFMASLCIAASRSRRLTAIIALSALAGAAIFLSILMELVPTIVEQAPIFIRTFCD